MVANQESIQSTIETFRRAAEVASHCSLRHGNIVELPPAQGDDVMVTADLHGHRRNFERILEVAALDEHPRRHLIMQEVCHGGPMYPSGMGCMSHLMLEEIAALQVKYAERFHFILSNHELAELTDFPIMKAKRMLNLLFRCGLQEMYGESADAVRDAAMAFLAALPLAVRLPGGVLVCHSLPAATDERGFDAGVFERELSKADISEGGDVFRMVWGRDYSQENAEAFAQATGAAAFITGHEPCEAGYQAPNSRQVIIDCCNHPACFAIVPRDGRPQSGGNVLGCVRFLHNDQPVANSSDSSRSSVIP
jgi:hypothetical protein